MKRFMLATTVETLLGSMGWKLEESAEFALHLYADYAGVEDAIHFHEGRLIMVISEGTVIHVSVNDETRSMLVGMDEVSDFKLTKAETKPFTNDRQGVFHVRDDLIKDFEVDYQKMVSGGSHYGAQEVVTVKS